MVSLELIARYLQCAKDFRGFYLARSVTADFNLLSSWFSFTLNVDIDIHNDETDLVRSCCSLCIV